MNRTPNERHVPRAPRSAERRAARARGAGFTLIEIVVALSAGLLVSMAAFSMSKNATAFFQNEARISSAQLALTLGMNRLTADLQRASFMATPNAQADPTVCRSASWGVVPGLQSFAGITIQAPPAPWPQNAAAGVTTDQVIIGGSLNTSESFTIKCLLPGAGAPTIQLQAATDDNAIARLTTSLGPGETLQAKLALIFVTGRFVNIFDPSTGFHVYGVIGAGPVVAGGLTTVQLAPSPSLPTRPVSPCGIVDPSVSPQCGGGLMVSVVSRVLYDIRSLAGAPMSQYAALVTPISPLTTGDAGRTELIRVELDASGAELQNPPLELVAEYAVDMRFGITVSTEVVNDTYNPTVTSYGIGNAQVYNIAGNVTGGNTTPQRIRAVEVRLATRVRAPDRAADLPVGADGRRLHYLVGNNFSPRYARLRTNYANVALPNQGGFSLW